MKILHRILLIILLICIAGMAATSVVRAKRYAASAESYIRYLDTKYGWDDLER